MKQVILAPVGRIEPDDVQGWLEQGGGMGLQRAWNLDPAVLRIQLGKIQRRDGQGMVKVMPRTSTTIEVNPASPIHRFIATEMPAFLIEGALIWARACEQAGVGIALGSDSAIRTLWQEVLAEMARIGITGRTGWTQTDIHLIEQDVSDSAHFALDPLTTRVFPIVLWEGVDPPVTLLHTTGQFTHQTIYEIPPGLSLREFVFNWAGGIPLNGKLVLGGRLLERHEWNLPLTYEQWGIHLGAGVLECK